MSSRTNWCDFDEASVLLDSTHPHCSGRPCTCPGPCLGRPCTCSGPATGRPCRGDSLFDPSSTPEQKSALLASCSVVPREFRDTDLLESLDDAMRESPVPGGRLSVSSGAASSGGVPLSGGQTPASSRVTFVMHQSTERLLQDAQNASSPPRERRSPSPSHRLSPSLFVASPDLLSLHSESPMPGDQSPGGVAAGARDRRCFDRVAAAAASLQSQVRSGAIDSAKVVGDGDQVDWVWDWSSRPEATPTSEAHFEHHGDERRRNADDAGNLVLFRLEIFSWANLPVLLMSHVTTFFLGAALAFVWVKKARH